MKATTPAPAGAKALADRASRHLGQLPAAAPVVNVYLTGCNINNGGQQIIGQHNTQIGQNAYGPADLGQQWQADTIRAQAATIAAQQRTIDRLLSIVERQAADLNAARAQREKTA